MNQVESETAKAKLSKKEFLLHEIREVSFAIAYLFISLSILETYKSLVLLQQGVNQFQSNYLFALIESLALGKIVALTQNLPFLKIFRYYSLAVAVLYQALVMTLITDVAGRIEDYLLPEAAKLVAHTGNPMALAITHQCAAMAIFTVLFATRGLDEAIGPGKLRQIFFAKPK